MDDFRHVSRSEVPTVFRLPEWHLEPWQHFPSLKLRAIWDDKSLVGSKIPRGIRSHFGNGACPKMANPSRAPDVNVFIVAMQRRECLQ
jgi:hypothetical protein